MANKMKILQALRQNLAMAGIGPELSFQPRPWNGKIMIGCFVLHLGLICIFAFTFLEAESFADYTQSSCIGISTAALCISFVLIIILNAKQLFECINRL